MVFLKMKKLLVSRRRGLWPVLLLCVIFYIYIRAPQQQDFDRRESKSKVKPGYNNYTLTNTAEGNFRYSNVFPYNSFNDNVVEIKTPYS